MPLYSFFINNVRAPPRTLNGVEASNASMDPFKQEMMKSTKKLRLLTLLDFCALVGIMEQATGFAYRGIDFKQR